MKAHEFTRRDFNVHNVGYAMEIRLPSIRDPQSLYDVYVVTVLGTILMGVILHFWHGTFVRVEMLVFIGIVFVWAGWAVYRVFGLYVDQST